MSDFDEYTGPHHGSASNEDPIAEKLQEAMYNMHWATWERAERIQRAKRLNEGKTLAEKLYAMAQEHKQAEYEVYDFVHSDDEEVIYLLNRLGVNPVTTKKVTITVEQGQPVHFITEGYALSAPEPDIGAAWK